jgi:hypothetical protein
VKDGKDDSETGAAICRKIVVLKEDGSQMKMVVLFGMDPTQFSSSCPWVPDSSVVYK